MRTFVAIAGKSPLKTGQPERQQLMAFHTKKQFCVLCGIKTRELSTYVKREKVIIGANDLIDDTVPENKIFLEKKIENKNPDSKNEPAQPVVNNSELAPLPPIDISNLPFDFDPEKPYTGKELEAILKALDIQKRKEEVDILRIKKEKQMGVVIPTALVKDIFAQQFKSVTAAFHNGADNYLMELSKLKGLNREEMAVMRGKLVEIINKSVDDAVNESKKLIKIIVAEHSDKRDVGEK